MIDQHDNEECHQIENRIFERLHRGIRILVPHQLNGPVEKANPQATAPNRYSGPLMRVT